MKLITRDTDYAIRALCFITKQNKRIVSASELVKELKMPRPFLRKILQQLNKKNILISHKGQSGGFTLARPAAKIYLVDLINAFQGPFELNECFFKKMRCPAVKTCALRKKIEVMQDYILSELRSITIASLLR